MMTRRHFLPTVATAAAGRGLASSDKVVLAIMGVRGRGRYHANRFAAMPDVEIAYLCEIDQNVVERAMRTVEAHKRRRPQLVGDLRKVLDDKAVDAVIIATPDHWHAPAAILACDAGKDVYVEKPLAHNIREGRLLIAAGNRNNRVVQVGTQARSRPCIQRAIEYVHSGKLGKVLAAKAWNVQMRQNIGHKPDSVPPAGVDWDSYVGPAPWLAFSESRFHYNWHWNWNFGTGDMGNDGIHQIDMALWAMGVNWPVEVVGMGRKMFFDDDQQTPDTMNLVFDYKDKLLLFEMRDWNPYRMEGFENGVAIYGSQGMMQIGELRPGVWGFRVFDDTDKVALVDDVNEDDTHARNFIDCIRTRQGPRGDLETAHRSTAHVHLGNIVCRTGRGKLRFDPKSESFFDDPEANRYLRRDYREHWATPKGA